MLGIIQGFAVSDGNRMRSVGFFLDNWYLFAMAGVSGGVLLWQSLQKGNGIGTAEAVMLINREKGVLIDVCEPAEYASGHAAGARNVPMSALAGAKELPGNKALPVIVLCASGVRAGRAAAMLRRAGHERAVAVAGGNGAWREANLPIEKSARSG